MKSYWIWQDFLSCQPSCQEMAIRWAPDDIVEHIKKWTYIITNPARLKCIDGRTKKENITHWGWFVAGGTIWKLASMLSVMEDIVPFPEIRKKLREDILKILVNHIWGEQNFSFHTDEHSKCDQIWCWHVKLILSDENRAEYHLSKESKDFIYQVIKSIEKIVTLDVLTGTHNEKWILLVNGEHKGIIPEVDWHQLFIYTPKLARRANKDLADEMLNNINFTPYNNIDRRVLVAMLQDKIDLHFKETVESLAPELPWYTVWFKANWDVKYINSISKDVYPYKQGNKN